MSCCYRSRKFPARTEQRHGCGLWPPDSPAALWVVPKPRRTGRRLRDASELNLKPTRSAAAAIDATRDWLLARQHPTATGAASWKATRSSKASTSCCWPGSAASNRRSPERPPRTSVEKQLPDRRLGHVSRRPARNQRQRQGLFRPEADGPRPARRLHAAGSRTRFAQPAGPTPSTASRGSISPCSGQISYDQCPAVPPELVLLPDLVAHQHLPHVGLVADDRRAAVDHVGPPAAARKSPRSAASASCFCATSTIGRRSAARASPNETRLVLAGSSSFAGPMRR